MGICAIYCRLSKEDIDKNGREIESESIQNQRAMLVDYATKQGWLIADVYVDDDYSGVDATRPAFNQLLVDAEGKKFDIILCKSQSRFTRDMEMVEKYIHNRFVLWGVRFVGMVDNVDTNVKGTKKSRQINGLVNEWYLEDLSQNIKGSFDIKREQGKYIASIALYGYLKDPEDKNKLLIDEKAADVVRRIFDLYLEGYGYRGIAHLFNLEGIANPSWYKFEQGIRTTPRGQTRLWGGSTVKAILVHQTYVGDMVQGYNESISYKTQKIKARPVAERIIVPNTHEPIISREIFERVQKLMAQRTHPKKNLTFSPLSGKLRCMDCNYPLVQAGRSEAPYYRCLTYADKGKTFCSIHSIPVDRLLAYVTDEVRKKINLYYQLSTEDFYDDQIVIAKKEKLIAKVRQLEREREAKEKAMENLYLDKVSGVITPEQFTRFNQTFHSENVIIAKAVSQLNIEIESLAKQKDDHSYLDEVIKKYLSFEALTSELVSEFIEMIYVGEKDKQSKEQVIKIDWLI